jgi:acetyl esterase/lipase
MSLLALALLPLLAQETIPLRADPKAAAALPEQVVDRGTGGNHDRAVSQVSRPSLTVYLPAKDKATGTAVVVCPGGGYERLAFDKEGHEVARWLTSVGIAGIVLKYRLPGKDNMKLAKGELHQATKAAHVAVEDAEEAMRVVRENAARWNIRPNAVGMMGFSAGGNLAALMGMVAAPKVRPDFLVLVYAAMPQTLEVTAATPRTFLVQAADDHLDAGDNSIRFFLALRKAGVAAELHVYESGGHGFGMRKNGKPVAAWPDVLAAWLAQPSPATAAANPPAAKPPLAH